MEEVQLKKEEEKAVQCHLENARGVNDLYIEGSQKIAKETLASMEKALVKEGSKKPAAKKLASIATTFCQVLIATLAHWALTITSASRVATGQGGNKNISGSKPACCKNKNGQNQVCVPMSEQNLAYSSITISQLALLTQAPPPSVLENKGQLKAIGSIVGRCTLKETMHLEGTKRRAST